jgi:trimethylguanosine synthase
MGEEDDAVFSSQQVLEDYDSDCTFIPANDRSPSRKQSNLPGRSEEASLTRHWSRRHDYFSRYDEGILLDRTGWYSVTPEAIARTIASLVPKNSIIYDGFVGLGGNAIQFAHRGLVIGTDIDRHRLLLCQHNARVYGVSSNIELIQGDFLQAAKFIRADAVFLSPPWGGPSCNDCKVYRLGSMPIAGGLVFEAARRVSSNVIYYLPRHSSITDLAKLDPEGWFRVLLHKESHRRIVAISALFGSMFVADSSEDPQDEEE